MNFKEIGMELEAPVIETAVTLLGFGDVFHRVVNEIQRVEAAHPNAAGKEKRALFLEECEIVLDDLVIPLIEGELRMLLELGLKFLAAQSAAAIADATSE